MMSESPQEKLWLASGFLDCLLSGAYPTTKRLERISKLLREATSELHPIAKGWAMPAQAYCTGGAPHPTYWKGSRYEPQIRVYLDRAPRGSKPVLILEASEFTA